MKKSTLTFLSVASFALSASCFVACNISDGTGGDDGEYTITYDLKGGEAQNPTVYTEITETFSLNEPTKNGYEFVGWTYSGQKTPQKNVTIEKWSKGNKSYTANYKTVDYTITYVLNDGVATNPETYTIETSTFTLNNPIKDGYEFIGWTYEGVTEPVETVTVEQGSVGNKTFIANYNVSANNYTITYELMDGVADNPAYYNENTETFTLNNPTKRGYEFIGWTYEGVTEPVMQVVVEKGSTGNLSFIANYEMVTYTLSYVLNGGIADNVETYCISADTFTLKNPVKDGYLFTGWTYEGVTEPVLEVVIESGSVGNMIFTANYREVFFEPLTISVFADVQLTTDKNQGSTSNAYLALKNHLNYAKSIGADVILMNGDIVNNAVESYYLLFEQALKTVYGNDETTYPEFVMNMGNHEWWDLSEHETADAVSLFNKYARIDTGNLVSKSSVPYYLDSTVTIPTYYKVIGGVPFLAISADKSDGTIGEQSKAEISAWLEDISKLESVQNGGPIYVAYHYPIYETTFAGEHTSALSNTINELLADYPNAIVFTGDTHFSGVNERTINQTDYTSINIGTSSYSRNVSMSATGYEYNNVQKGSGKSSAGVLLGDVSFKYEYTPTMMVLNLSSTGKTSIDRYFTDVSAKDAKHIGITWEIPLINSKNDFIYTDERFENTDWAYKLYNDSGLSWADGEVLTFNVSSNKMFVNFNDVTAYNCAEHYRIEVKDASNAENVKYYDFTGHYYKYDSESHTFNLVLENIPQADNYVVTVTAYDFFDNPSKNVLTASSVTEELSFPDTIDIKTVETYSDISKRVNYEEVAENSNSSVEYYFKGTKDYSRSGMLLDRVIIGDGKTANLKDHLSVTDWSNAVLTCKVKNLNNYSIQIGLTLVTNDGTKETWITDGGEKLTVPANGGWVTLKWELVQLGIGSDIISNLALKAFIPSSAVDTENGYEVNFIVDDLDIVNGELSLPSHYTAILSDKGFTQKICEVTTSEVLSFDYKLIKENATPANSMLKFMIFNGSDWNNWISYITINVYNNASSHEFVTITALEDGWYNVKIDLTKAPVNGEKATVDGYTLSCIYSRNQTNCTVAVDNFTAEEPEAPSTALTLDSAGFTITNIFEVTTSQILSFNYKLVEGNATPANSTLKFMIFNGSNWSNWISYITINVYNNASSHEFVTITALEDGWYNVKIDLTKAPVNGDKATVDGYTLSSIYAMANHTNCTVVVDKFTAEELPAHSNAVKTTANVDSNIKNVFDATTSQYVSFEMKLDTPAKEGDSKIAIMFYSGNDLDNRLNYINIYPLKPDSSHSSVKMEALSDGWMKVTIDLSKMPVLGTITGNITSMYVRGNWSTCGVLLDNFQAESAPAHINAVKTTLGTALDLKNVFVANSDQLLTFEIKPASAELNNDSRIEVMLYNGIDLNNRLNYIRIYLHNTSASHSSVTTEALEDGWMKVTIDLSKMPVLGTISGDITSIYVHATWSTAEAWLDNFQVENK